MLSHGRLQKPTEGYDPSLSVQIMIFYRPRKHVLVDFRALHIWLSKEIVCEVEDALMKLNRGQFIFQDNEGHLRRVTVR